MGNGNTKTERCGSCKQPYPCTCSSSPGIYIGTEHEEVNETTAPAHAHFVEEKKEKPYVYDIYLAQRDEANSSTVKYSLSDLKKPHQQLIINIANAVHKYWEFENTEAEQLLNDYFAIFKNLKLKSNRKFNYIPYKYFYILMNECNSRGHNILFKQHALSGYAEVFAILYQQRVDRSGL